MTDKEITDPDSTTRKPLLSRETVLPIGVVIVACVSAWQVSGALATNTAETLARFKAIEQKLDFIEQQMVSASESRWKKSDMQVWVELLRAQNPGLTIPAVR